MERNRRPQIPESFRRGSVDDIAMTEVNPGPSWSNFPSKNNSKQWKFSKFRPNTDIEGHAEKIADKLQEKDDLMGNSALAEQLRLEAVRDLPQSLTLKRCVKAKLTKSVSEKSRRRPISWYKSLKYRLSLRFSRLSGGIKNFGIFEMWYKNLKNVEGNFGSGYASYFKFLRWTFLMTCVVGLFSLGFIIIPQITYDLAAINRTSEKSVAFSFQDIFSGNGSLKKTVLFYGHYTNSIIDPIENLVYKMPIAYLVVMLILYLTTFSVISINVAHSYRRNYIETEGGLKNVYANKIFSGWDFAIATRHASDLKKSSIYHELKELLSESLREDIKLSFVQNLLNIGKKIVINLVIFVILGLIGYSLWLLLQNFSLNTDNSIFVPTIIINLILLIIPVVFNHISRLEIYKNPRTIIYINLFRTFLLGVVILGVVLAFWLIQASKPNQTAEFCWETALGQEIYRLVIFDFIFSVLASSFIEISWIYLEKARGKTLINSEEFDIARHTLSVIYNQGLCWVGFLFSPLLPIILIIKSIFVWYLRYFLVVKFCKPPRKTWRAAQLNTCFLILTFIMMLLVISLHGYILTSINTSKNCGPFRDHDFIYEMITGRIEDLKNYSTVWRIILYLTKPWVVSLFIIALGIWVYYTKEQAEAQREKVRILKDMLVWEAKDKEFLLQQINRQTGEQVDNLVNLGKKRLDNPILSPPPAINPPEGYLSEFGDDLHSRYGKYA